MANDHRAPNPSDSGRRTVQTLTAWFLSTRTHWLRGLLMVAFFLVLGFLKLVVGLMALFQFGSLLILGKSNRHLAQFGTSLGRYAGHLVAYLLHATDRLPFPFSEWPRSVPPDPESSGEGS